MGLKQITPSALAEQRYGVRQERPFFAGLVDFITSGPVVAMVWEGDGVIASARKLIGATKPSRLSPAPPWRSRHQHWPQCDPRFRRTGNRRVRDWSVVRYPELNNWTPSDQVWRVEA